MCKKVIKSAHLWNVGVKFKWVGSATTALRSQKERVFLCGGEGKHKTQIKPCLIHHSVGRLGVKETGILNRKKTNHVINKITEVIAVKWPTESAITPGEWHHQQIPPVFLVQKLLLSSYTCRKELLQCSCPGPRLHLPLTREQKWYSGHVIQRHFSYATDWQIRGFCDQITSCHLTKQFGWHVKYD